MDLGAQISAELDGARYGEKAGIIAHWAKVLGKSEGAIRRMLVCARGKVRNYKRAGNEHYRKIATLVAAAKKQIAREGNGRAPSTADILERLAEDGKITPPIPSVGTVNRLIRSLVGDPKDDSTPSVRIEASYPNEAHHLDFSVSTMLVAGDEPGTVLITGEHTGYKRPRNQRVWLAGLVDSYSRLMWVKYYLVAGESAKLGIDFLREFWSDRHDPLYPFGGIPDKLITDNGSFGSSALAQSLCEGAGVELITIKPGNKRANGKVERRWRWLWESFESWWTLRKGEIITLEEANDELRRWLIKKAYERHPVYMQLTRMQAWSRIENLRYARGEWAIVPLQRKVSNSCTVRVDNKYYGVPAYLRGKTITVHIGADGPTTYDDPVTGLTNRLKPYEPVKLGEFRAIAATEDEKAVEQLSQEAILTAHIVAGPVRTGATAAAPQATAVRRSLTDFPSIEHALTYISGELEREIGAPLPQEARDKLSLVIGNDLSRQNIDEILNTLRRNDVD